MLARKKKKKKAVTRSSLAMLLRELAMGYFSRYTAEWKSQPMITQMSQSATNTTLRCHAMLLCSPRGKINARLFGARRDVVPADLETA